jgi:DNA-binding transcriptional LysR family regulator
VTRFIVAPDGHGEPCVFAADQFSLEHRTMVPVAVLRRSDLDPEVRRFWDEIAERLTADVR